jgi:hypothetical protein
MGAAAVVSGIVRARRARRPVTFAIQAPIRQDWLDKRHEEIIEPGLPIVDPHHHLWDRPGYRYLFQDLLADIGSGHNIRATLFEECGAMYRTGGPQELRSLGETEFVSGVARMSASGKYGLTRCCAGIIGNVDLRIGFRAKAVLEQHWRFPTVVSAASEIARPGWRPEPQDLFARAAKPAVGQELSRRLCCPRCVLGLTFGA